MGYILLLPLQVLNKKKSMMSYRKVVGYGIGPDPFATITNAQISKIYNVCTVKLFGHVEQNWVNPNSSKLEQKT